MRKLLLILTLLFSVSSASALPLGGSGSSSGGGGGGGSVTVNATDVFVPALQSVCAGCWVDLGAFVTTAPTLNSVIWNCAATPCTGAPVAAQTAAAIAGPQGPPAIMSQWAGGTLDTDDEVFMVWGGGHQSYYGNELYGFDLHSLIWKRLTVPSDTTGYVRGTDARQLYPSDSMPVPSHTYDGQLYVPGRGFYSIMNCGADSGGCGFNSFKVAYSALSPTAFNVWQTINQPSAISFQPGPDQSAHFDPTTGLIYVQQSTGNAQLWHYDPANDAGGWTNTGGLCQMQDFHMTGAIRPGNYFATVGTLAADFRACALSTGNTVQSGTSGDTTIATANAPGFVWDQAIAKFIGWNGGANTYQLDPATWSWAAHAPNISNTVTPKCSQVGNCTSATGVQNNGTFGRFQYDWQHAAFIVVNTTDDHVYAYKPDTCPSGSPSPDQSVMIPPSPCTLIDVAGSQWTFPSSGTDDGYGNKTIDLNGVDFTHISLVGINLSGNLYFGTRAMFSPYFLYTRRNQGNGEFYQVANLNSPLPSPPFLNSTTATTYQSMQDMFAAAIAGQTLIAHVMPTGIPAYSDFGTVNKASTTLNCDSGVILSTSNGAGPGQGIFAVEANAFTINGCEIAWTQATASNGPNVGIQIDHGFTGFTGTNLNLHDNDMNILGGGQTGAITLTNVTAKRGGSKVQAGSGDGFNHNIYLSWNNASPDTDSVTMTGGGSFDVTADGDDLKFRLATGSVKGVTVGCDTAGNEGTHNGCWENWPVDIGCGGQYTLGAAGAGNGIVIERSPGAVKSQLVSFGEDIPAGVPNCPATARASQSLVITNAILIDDGPLGDGGSTTIVNNPQAKSVTVSNSKLVCGPNSNCASIASFLGVNVTDGGGNTLFANRTAASLSAYPALPSPP